eukprot:659902-Prymnesium_polylepis.2
MYGTTALGGSRCDKEGRATLPGARVSSLDSGRDSGTRGVTTRGTSGDWRGTRETVLTGSMHGQKSLFSSVDECFTRPSILHLKQLVRLWDAPDTHGLGGFRRFQTVSDGRRGVGLGSLAQH